VSDPLIRGRKCPGMRRKHCGFRVMRRRACEEGATIVRDQSGLLDSIHCEVGLIVQGFGLLSSGL
jgi:hypothetical protein